MSGAAPPPMDSAARSTPVAVSAPAPDAPAREGGRVVRDTRALAGWGLLALLAYVPVLRSAPGRVAADTKQYLYLDPGRLMSRAVSMWDPNVGMGTVTHQTIGYLFPMGPYYWTLDKLGVPDWVAQRVWLGSLLFFAAAGVLYLLRTFGLRGPGVVVAALAYMLTPYTLDYTARISVLLMPWAALPWMIGLIRKALRDGGWRYPALFALVVQIVGGVNATALVFAGVGPVLWILYAWLVARDVHWRRAVTVTAKTGLLTGLASLWWIAGLSVQGAYGLNILKYTETVEAVARTSTPNEVLRGLGYWFFYGQDRLGPWIEAATDYTQRPVVVLAGYGLTCLALLAAGFLRWRHRVFFVAMLLVGVVISVGAHPYGSPTPLGALFKSFANSSTAGLALRSTGRAAPLVVLSLAVLLGVGVNVVVPALQRAGRATTSAAVVGLVMVLVLVNMPAVFKGTFYGKNLQRPEEVPQYWKDATRALDARGDETRVLELPGADFASYRWGNTVDPITPGMMDRPYVARELIPYGEAGTADLLNAIDRRIQEGLFDPAGFVPLMRRMGVGDVVLRNDIQYERYDLASPRELAREFAAVPALGAPTAYGPPSPFTTAKPSQSEKLLASPANEPPQPPVVTYPVERPTPIVRAESPDHALMVAGDGEGLIDVADIGLLDGAGVVQYAGSFATDHALRAALRPDTTLVVTDSNRLQARRWSTVRDNLGNTQQPGEQPLVVDLGDARLDVFPDARATSATTMEQRGVKSVTASSYGNTISYTPEDRAARALDGDPTTAWRAAAFGPAIGQKIKLELARPMTTDSVNLAQPINGARDRYITEVALRFDGDDEVRMPLGEVSRTAVGETLSFPRRTFRTLEIEVTNDNRGPRRLNGSGDAVGFAEIRLRDERADHDLRVDEVTRMPTDLLHAAGKSSHTHPLVLVLRRDRVEPVPPRHDPEPAIARELTLPTARTFSLTGTARLSTDASHNAIDRALGLPALEAGGVATDAREFLQGCIKCRADGAVDGDPATAWNTPFVGVRGQWAEYTIAAPITFDHMTMQVVADGRHSVPTRIRLQVDDAVRDLVLPDVADQPGENATVTVPLTFAPMSGRRVRVTVVDVRETQAFSYYANHPLLLPAAIAELGVPGLGPVPATQAGTQVSSECRSDLLTVDGRAVPMRVAGDRASAERLAPLTVQTCDPSDPTRVPALHLGAGAHVVRAAPGAHTAIGLDRLVLASAAGGAALESPPASGASRGSATPATPRVEVTKNGRTSMRVHVDGATAPFWLVLGQSQSKGWKATIVDGVALGGSRLVDGYANGWLVRPARPSFDVVLDWTPQRGVAISLLVSVAVTLLCIAIAFVTWWRRRGVLSLVTAPDAEDADTRFVWPGEGEPALRSRARIAVPLGVGVLGALVVAPWVGVLAAVLTAAAVWRPRLRVVLVLGPAVLIGWCALYIVWVQRRFRFPPVFEWPTLFPRARTLAWLALVLLAADVLLEAVRARYASRPPEETRVGDSDD